MAFNTPYHIRFISSYPPRKCGIGTFTRNLGTALQKNLTGEVASLSIAAIDNGLGENAYHIPVDVIIEQNNPLSWQKAADNISTRTYEKPGHPTIIILEHEYGLDGNNWETGTNYIELAKRLRNRGLTTFTQLHTVLEQPQDHQKKILQEFAETVNGIIVPSVYAKHILSSETYGIDPTKIEHIDHGIRMQKPIDRKVSKKKYGLEKKFIVSTLGLKSEGKGLEYAIEGYGNFINNSLTKGQRKDIIYIIAGDYHPDYREYNEGKNLRNYEQRIERIFDEQKIKVKKTNTLTNLSKSEFENNDIVLLEKFLTEKELLEIYAITNTMLITPRNREQISSGILADTIGSRRVAIATKFTHAIELLYGNGNINKAKETGLIGLNDPHNARGILVDLTGENRDVPDIEQISQGLDYLVFNKKARLMMEHNAWRRGYKMREEAVAWNLVQLISRTLTDNTIKEGRGTNFNREIESPYQTH
jgi:polysaccharide biosynthesis protein PslF